MTPDEITEIGSDTSSESKAENRQPSADVVHSPSKPKGDPAKDASARYDYVGGSLSRSSLVDDLVAVVEGDVRFDEYTRQLYATDASAYEMTPIGVVMPVDSDDVAAVVEYCAEQQIPVLPRGGGTSLAGQAVNEAVVLDFTQYMDGVHEVDPDDATARVGPGVVLDELNQTLAAHKLKFAPDPAAGDRSVVGGAIGNNSTGSHSLKYGKTDAYIEECEVVLADGTVTTFGEETVEELRARADSDGDLEVRVYAELVSVLDDQVESIRQAYPRLKRNVSGYNLDRFLDEAEDGTVNLARLLAGSEGTLAIVTEATVSLEPVPATKALALLTYEDLDAALRDVSPTLDHDPAAVEVLDDVLLDLARETEAFGDLVEMLPTGTRAVLLVEFYADDETEGRRSVADLFADRVPAAEASIEPGTCAGARTTTSVRAFDALEAHDEAERKIFWKLRKSGMPILLGRTSDEKHISFVEDSAVPPENLPEYVADVQDVLAENGTFASFYAHAGPGCLHVRPLINTKTDAGIRQMERIADEIADLVVKYDGSVSGEHGDGRARTQWNHKLYGDDVWDTFRDLKAAFDPDWVLNPGNVCGRPPNEIEMGDAVTDRSATVPDMTEHLRFDSAYEFDALFEPTLYWENDNGMQGMVELCHGCGGCRGEQETTGGVMCPTYRASGEESTATRGRANILRRAMSGELPADEAFTEEFVTEVLDLCIGCKGCARDCPSEVDMAKLKAELTHEYHQREGASLRDRVFADIEGLSRLGSATAPVSNWLPNVPGARLLMEKTLGIARDRKLPTFARTSLTDWMTDRTPTVAPADADHRVVLFPDTYTNYNDPAVGKAAVRVLEAVGVHVVVPRDIGGSGRPAFSKGFLEMARERARENVEALTSYVDDGRDVVVVEPSDAVMIQSDYRDLLGDSAAPVADNTYGVMEYIDVFDLDIPTREPTELLTYHGHCHQKASERDLHAPTVLHEVGYDVDVLDSGCCGMAGSFGYEVEHASMSEAIAEILFDQVADSDGTTVVAPGTSCRSQLVTRDDAAEIPAHPIQLLDRLL